MPAHASFSSLIVSNILIPTSHGRPLPHPQHYNPSQSSPSPSLSVVPLAGDDRIQVLLGLLQPLPLDRHARLVRVLVVHAEISSPRLARLLHVPRLARVLPHPVSLSALRQDSTRVQQTRVSVHQSLVPLSFSVAKPSVGTRTPHTTAASDEAGRAVDVYVNGSHLSHALSPSLGSSRSAPVALSFPLSSPVVSIDLDPKHRRLFDTSFYLTPL